ncbi:MAG TPA: S53 family peptidase [Streptosporangiaceae bacterium]
MRSGQPIARKRIRGLAAPAARSRALLGAGALLATATAGAVAGVPAAAGLAGGHRPAAALAAVRVTPMIRVPSARLFARPTGGYTPAQIRGAYDLAPLTKAHINGTGESIVIVDSFGSPTIRHDLGVFDRQFGLPAPRALTIIHPAGPIPPFQPTSNRISWAEETTLDVEWAHAMAPRARIVLAETPVSENEGRSGFPQIETAEKYVLAHRLGGVISQSFGATEQTFPKGSIQPLRGMYIEAASRSHRVTVVSASGDAGATDYHNDLTTFYTKPVTSWPASDPLVTAVGGTDVALNSRGGRVRPDQVWNDPGFPSAGGGGKSVVFARPAYQNKDAAVTGAHRGVPDISLSASCSHPVDVYKSFSGRGWQVICGTSEATPLFAGVIALADQAAGHWLGAINPDLYKLAGAGKAGIVDVTKGDNTVSFSQGGKSYTVHGWKAVPGYDLASGLGTVNAGILVRKLAALARK